MTGKSRLRTGAIAAVLAVAVMFSGAATPATGDDSPTKIWVGPGCPGDDWTCQADGPVVQESEGDDLFATCTLDDCVISQSNTTGSNTIVVTQETTLSSSSGLLDSVNQDESQSAHLTQTNGSGKNSIDVDQTIVLDANSSPGLLVTNQTQEAHQAVNIPNQRSDSGDQDITIDQVLDVSAVAEGLSTVQNQNVQNQIGQFVEIGSDSPADLGMDTISGSNELVVNQSQDFSADATGPLGLPLLLSSVQNQGAQNQDFPAAQLIWKVNSQKFDGSNVTGTQTKAISQGTEPDVPLLGKVQNIFDELAVIGQLLTTDRSDVTQEATLTQDGSYARCVQLGDVHNEINGTLSQNCNGIEQEVSGRHYTAHLETCEGDPPPGEECTPTQETTVSDDAEVQGDEGCGTGFWKNNLGDWPDDVGPNDLFGSHFTGAPAEFAGLTMHAAVSLGGGPVNNLVRQAVAALNNARHLGVEYALHSKQVKEKVNTAFAEGTGSAVGDELDGFNNGDGGCPLD